MYGNGIIYFSDSSNQHAPVEVPAAPAMAFTIDFSTGDAKMGDKDCLSKFKPVKGRRSFRSRSLKQKSEDADDDKQVMTSLFYLGIKLVQIKAILLFSKHNFC